MKRLAWLFLIAAPLAAQPGQFAGVASCANSGCHGSTLPLQSSRVLQNEYYTWLNSDRHARAYNILFNALSVRIVRNMHLKKKAYQETLCLDCHSTNVPASKVAGRIDPEDGVQCETCHGPAGGWRGEHTEAGWTHEQSVARGMIDLRDLRVRAHGCDRCHLGSAEKDVDHELIASGHPLLAFELDNYTETMPAHWTPRKETHGVPAWAVGQAMAFRDSLANLARHARGNKWPEFSDMSCANCHHALEGSTWRQERGWTGRAGLPAWSPKQWAVLRLVVDRAAPSARAQLDDAVRTVAARVARMNDPSGVASAADAAKRSIETALPRITALPWRDADVRTMMRTITADDAVTYDLQTAQQAALALQSLAAALTRNNPALLKSAMTQALDALFAEVQTKDRYEPARFAQKLAALRTTL
ncbi:MAG: multiheme c-type cytochrome [Acidobacteriota bacterium]